jgi:hypothetical protein
MLRNIVRKELILNRKTLVFTALPYLAWFGFLLSEQRIPAGEYLVMSAVMAVFYQVVLFVREDKLKTAALTCSLPVTRRSVVRARHRMACALCVFWVGAAILVAVVLPWTAFPLERVIAPTTVGVALSIALLGTAILFPLVVRLGLVGVMVVLGGLQVLGLGAFIVTDLVGPAMSMRAVFRWLTGSIRSLHGNLGHPGFALLWAAAVLAVLAMSCRASMWLYERRDL